MTTANMALPVAIGVLAAFLVMAPLTMGGDASFHLDEDKVDVANKQFKVQQARYRGTDDKGQPFELDAGSALQKRFGRADRAAQDLAAAIRLSDGPARLTAPSGRYDMDSQRVAVDGPVQLRAPDNYTLDTRDAVVDLRTRRLASDAGEVTGTVRQGKFRADRLEADMEDRTVTLRGNARLRIDPA
ncbi:LPS export ABC transporter periplasmic protein LptC [Sphingomonas sp. MMS24-JH45]